MVSHIDSDHVAGMVDFAGELVTAQQDSEPLRYDVRTLWHNSFDDVLGNDADDLRAAAIEALAVPLADRVADEIRAAGLAVVASVPKDVANPASARPSRDTSPYTCRASSSLPSARASGYC